MFLFLFFLFPGQKKSGWIAFFFAKFETSVLVLRAPLGAPRFFLAPFGGLTRFPLHFQSILRRLEGLKRLKTHDEGLPPHRLLAGAKGGAQGGADRYPRIQGGELTPCPPCRGGAEKHWCKHDCVYN